jgi:hypothetical protein
MKNSPARLVDDMTIELGKIGALVVHGDAEALARGATAHLDAGADHVAVQVLGPDPRPALRALSGALGLASS